MGHSIAAKYAARPAARFVTPASLARTRRLGLRATGSFRPAPTRATVLRALDVGPLVAMRAASRAIRPANGHRPTSGPPRPVTTIHWARSGRSGKAHRPSAAMAPWRA
jgi:hypothetical protein